jgi:norsolorinic acid ketoreductase
MNPIVSTPKLLLYYEMLTPRLSGILEVLVARPNTAIVAAVRDVTSATKALSTVTVGEARKLIIVKIDSTSDIDPFVAVDELKSKHGITKVDVLLSNAGLLDTIAPVLKTPAEQVRKHFEVNTIAPMLLLQAFSLFSRSLQHRSF